MSILATVKAFQHWKSLAIGAAFVAVAGFAGWQTWQLKNCGLKVADLKVEVAELSAEKAGQSAMVEAWETVAADRQKVAMSALEAARNQTVVRTNTVREIMREVPVGDECAATLALLRKYQTP